MTPAAPSETPFRLGLIGAGAWGRNYIDTIAAADGLELVRLATRTPARHALAPPGCRVDTDWRTVAEADDVDGVVVATPPRLHAEMASAAVGAGLPVLVEKPLTTDPREAEELLKKAERLGVLVMVDHVHLFSAAFRALKREAASMGRVVAIRSEAGRWGPFRSDTPVLWDWGPHDVAMCMDLLGRRPGFVAAKRKTPIGDGPEGGEDISLALDFGGGLIAEIGLNNMRREKRRRFAVQLTDGRLVYDDTKTKKLVRFDGVRDFDSEPVGGTAVPIDPEPPLTTAVRCFAEAARAGSTDLSSLRLGVAVTGILAAGDDLLASAGTRPKPPSSQRSASPA